MQLNSTRHPIPFVLATLGLVSALTACSGYDGVIEAGADDLPSTDDPLDAEETDPSALALDPDFVASGDERLLPQLDGSDAAEGAPSDLDAAPSEASPLGTANFALGIPRVWAHRQRHFGGNFVEQIHFPTISKRDLLKPYGDEVGLGQRCSPGYERSGEPEIRSTGFGHCRFAGWLNPDDKRDCRAKLEVKTAAFFGSNVCEWKVFEERAAGGSCGRRGEYCGGEGNDGSCFCDPGCQLIGDCCLDYRDQCR